MNAIGIDYSASKKPANKIWVADCKLENNSIILNQIYSLKEKIKYNSLNSCNLYLVNLVKNNINYSFGFDFSFSIPDVFFPEHTWEELILVFKKKWISANLFKENLLFLSDKKELKRSTEIEAKVPFSTYNLWIYKQTYYGITEILAPLLQANCCKIIPFQSRKKNYPAILETCPASFLKFNSGDSDLSKYYKGKKEANLERRTMILEILENNFNLKYNSNDFKNKILSNMDGDALDSLICAIIVIKRSYNNFEITKNSKLKKEGYVYY